MSVIRSEFLTLRAMINHCSHPEQESYQGGPWAVVVILVVSYARPLTVMAWPWVCCHASSSSRWRGCADPIVVVVGSSSSFWHGRAAVVVSPCWCGCSAVIVMAWPCKSLVVFVKLMWMHCQHRIAIAFSMHISSPLWLHH